MNTSVKQLAHKFTYAGTKKCSFTRHYYRDGVVEDVVAMYRDKYSNTDIFENLYTMAVKDDASKDARSIWRANKEQAPLTGDFVIDLDLDNAGKTSEVFDAVRNDTIGVTRMLCSLLKLRADQIKIYWSGNKGFHIVVPYNGLFSIKNLNKGYYRLAMWLKRYFKTIDMTLYDEQRVCRVSNSINSKTGMYCVRVSLQRLQKMSLEDMKEWASVSRPDKKVRPISDKQVSYFLGENSKRLSRLISRGSKKTKKRPSKLSACGEKEKCRSAQSGRGFRGAGNIKKTHPSTPTVKRECEILYLYTPNNSHDATQTYVSETELPSSTMSDFTTPGSLSEHPITMSVPQAIAYVKSSIDMERLTGLYGQFCDVFHAESTPSACWLHPDAQHKDWVYKCSSASSELALDSIGFTMYYLQCSPMDALLHLCSKADIKLLYNNNTQKCDIHKLIRANKLAYKDFGKVKGASLLIKALKEVYHQCCDDIIEKAERNNMTNHGDDTYGAVSQRYLSKKLGKNNAGSDMAKKLILLASLGLVQRVTDEDLPFYNSLKKMPFYKKCLEEYGITLQYYKLADLSGKETRKVVRDRLKLWVATGVPIKKINRTAIAKVLGEDVASAVYAKHDALVAKRLAKASEAIRFEVIRGYRDERTNWLRKEMRRQAMYGYDSDEWVFVPATAPQPRAA